MRLKLRLFLDTSALFAGIWSAEGGARMLLRLGEAEAYQILLSSQVLKEIEDVIRRKAELYLPILAILIDRSQASIVPAAPGDVFERWHGLMAQAGDARILADAWHNEAEYLVTQDRAHFLNTTEMSRLLPFPVGTPGDCLAWYRGRLLRSVRH